MNVGKSCSRERERERETLLKTNSTHGKRKKSNSEQQVHRLTQNAKPVACPVSTPRTAVGRGGGDWQNDQFVRAKLDRNEWETPNGSEQKKQRIIADLLVVLLLLLLNSPGGV